ncbi:MAG: hypothetical protein JOZ75_04600, partial [Candidatus Dormibacteraeota bacterium]|nr:hypothetical protein [Candidatus Dormibacteraeota bacterium]
MAVYNIVWAIVLLPFAGAIVSFLAETQRRAAQTCFVTTVAAFLLSAVVLGARLTHAQQPSFISLLPFFQLTPTENTQFAARYTAQLGVLVDSLSATFAFVLTFVLAVVQGYALASLRSEPGLRRFFWASSVLAATMVGLVYSPNLFQTLLMWSLASAAVYVIAAFWWSRADAATPARRAFLAIYVADVALLLGLVFIFGKFGLFSSTVPAPPGQPAADPFGFDQFTRNAMAVTHGLVAGAGIRTLAVLAAVLIFAAVVRAAQGPFHVWLADNVTSPIPAIALIATTAGFGGAYLIARAYPLLLPPLHAISAIALTGAVTALFAAAVALAQRDLLRVAVLMAVAQFGLVFAALGVGGYGQGLFVLFTSLLFTTLFVFAAGNLVRVYRTRNIHEMGGALHRMRTTATALLVWAGGTAGLSLATYYTLSSVFENAKPSGPAVGSLTRVVVAVLVVVAAGLIAAAAARVLFYVLPGEPARRRGFQPDRIGEAEPGVRFLTRLTTAGAVIAVLAGLPGVGRFTFTRFVFEYTQPVLPVDWFGLLLCLVAGGAGAALAWMFFAPARRAAAAPLIARAEPLTHLVTRDFDLERSAHRLGAPFLAAGEFVSRFDANVTEA